jgi:hypothetical protein
MQSSSINRSKMSHPASHSNHAKHVLEPPPQLHTHRLPCIHRPRRSLLILRSPAQQKVQAFCRRAPGHALDYLSLLVHLHSRILHQALRNLVRHALQLRIRQAGQRVCGLGSKLTCADGFGGEDGGQIVCCEDDVDFGERSGWGWGRDLVGPGLLDDGFGAGVVHGVGAFFGVEGEFFGLRAQVCAADELDARDIAFLAGGLEVSGQTLRDGAQVALVGDVDDGALAVVDLLEGEGPGFETGVGEFFFGTGEERHAFSGGGVAGGEDGGPHLGGGRLLGLEKVEGVTAKTRPSKKS